MPLPVFAIRVAVAAIQAALLYGLTGSVEAPRSWPATEPLVFAPMLLVSVYGPVLVLLGLGQIRLRPLAIWASVAAAVIAGLGYFDLARGRVDADGAAAALWPSFSVDCALAIGLFIAQALVIDSVLERRLAVPYPRHFDTAWKQGLQVALSAGFVGLFWAVLYLGAALFKLVDIDVFQRLITHRWFACPATTLALAASVHLTDVQPALIRGMRTLALTLFSWLLPVLAAILLGFLGLLPFVSLAPLWQTHFAARLVLTAAILLIFLINACYQDGAGEPSRVKRWAALAGALELLPLAGLAAWALALRVGQYGWSVERVIASAVTLIIACYALGYAVAALRSPVWLKRIEITNLGAAYVILALILALFSPLADPGRLMVADQVARLQSGAVAADKFDFTALRFDGARWGAAALAELAQAKDRPDAALIAAKASAALNATNRYALVHTQPLPLTPEQIATHIEMRPAGGVLPAGFIDANFGEPSPQCFLMPAGKCLARAIALPSGAAAVLLIDGGTGFLFETDGGGQWRKMAILSGSLYLAPIRDALANGDFQFVPHGLPDLLAAGERLELTPIPAPKP